MDVLSLAKTYIQQKKFDAALAELKKTPLAGVQDDELHILLGLAHQGLKEFEPAVKEFRAALNINPRNSDISILMGNVYNEKGDYALAEDSYRQAINRGAKNKAQAYFELGKIHENRDRYEEAIEEYEASLEIGHNRDLSFRLIQLYRVMGKWEDAERRVLNDLRFISEKDVFLKNILLNELEMSQRKTVLSTKIRSFTITLTNRCNLGCLACEARRYQWEMPKETAEEIMGYLPYLEYIMWQGGEAFLVDYFKDLLEETKHFPHIKQTIVTNGMLLSEDLIANLMQLPDIVLTISVDGVTKDVYEYIRRGAKFDKLIKNLEIINSMRKHHNSGMRLHLNVTIMKSNYHQLLGFIDFAKEYGFGQILFRPVQGNFNNEENIFYHRDKVALNLINKMMGEIYMKAQKYQITLDNRIPALEMSHSNTPYTHKDGRQTNNSGLLCYAPWQRLYISWGGNVYPDCMCFWPQDAGIGNVMRESIREIWNNAGMQLYRKKIIENNYMDLCSKDCISGNVPKRYLAFNK